MTGSTSSDEVRERRARIARLVEVGKALGYGLYAVAIVAFVIGFLTSYDGLVRNLIVWGIVVGSLVLAPAIVFGYGVKAAEREDREAGR